MSKTVRKVFLILGTLVLCFLVWQLVFNKGGIVRTGYNALADVVNEQYAKAAGSGKTVLARWEASNAKSNGTATGVNIKP